MLKLKQVSVIKNFDRKESYGHLDLYRVLPGKKKRFSVHKKKM